MLEMNGIEKNIVLSWCNLYETKFKLLSGGNTEGFCLEKFKVLVKETYKYVQQLNNKKVLPMYSTNDISFYSCMRIVDMLYQYSSNKVFNAEDYCDFYEDLDNYSLLKMQITIKATQLIAESLAFAISLVPKEKLNGVIGVIYNSQTIDYDIEKGNVEDIIKAVFEFPDSEN